jgi:hypothetical protein
MFLSSRGIYAVLSLLFCGTCVNPLPRRVGTGYKSVAQSSYRAGVMQPERIAMTGNKVNFSPRHVCAATGACRND